MTKKRRRYAPEVKERAVRLFHDSRGDHPSEWAAMCSVATKIGCTADTLRTWVRRAEQDADGGSSASAAAERIKELERENRELQRANEILRKASAYFAQAELDRRPKKW